MKRDCCIVLVLVSILSLIPADAFLVPASPLRAQASSLLTMEATKDPQTPGSPWINLPRKILAPATLAFATWQSTFSFQPGILGASSSVFPGFETVQSAHAARPSNAPSSAGSRVNKDAESLLRYGLPINSKEARELQEAVEGVKENIRGKRLNEGKKDVQRAKSILASKREKLLKAVRPDGKERAQELLKELEGNLDELTATFAEDAGRGSEQERAKLDLAYKQQLDASRAVTEVEELMVPAGYTVSVPEEFSNLPQLQGRAEVDMVLKKGEAGEKFEIKGKLYDSIQVKMVIDGFNAPVTAGNFVDLVQKGFYNNRPITRSDGFVVQYGDPDPQGEVHGYVPFGSKDVRTIPLEIFVAQDESPMYGMTTEDDGRGYSATRLPFQAYGAIGMAREEYVADSASSQVFWLLFESDLTPAGKNLLDGRYTCFGYTTENADLLAGVKEGDVIVSAKVVKGGENLVKK
ncbi:peptidyl-prolyl cis-trans isomerase [Nannochloropsis gaditana]|uniref:peptidylprolyl isomerase n=1 Tax=Nannochloropsis gaditana TaxID=72520 RepID=W7TQJ8_9STRA|nr:peptidyl-prolyl cis-trans isomerase [Nannochloropsis gaditana]